MGLERGDIVSNSRRGEALNDLDRLEVCRDEIEELADNRNEWAWAADELALLCQSTGHESTLEGAAIWARADAAVARYAVLSRMAEEEG